MDKKTFVYYGLGMVCWLLELFIKEMPAFEDQNFVCGTLVGMSIVLLLHGVFFMGRNIAKFRDEKKDK